MPHWLNWSLGYFNILPFILTILLYRKVDPVYRPFFILIILGCLNDWISMLTIKHFKTSNSTNSGIYIIFDLLLILLFFYRLRPALKKMLFVLACTGVAIWVADNF